MINVTYDREAKVFVGYCTINDIYSQGDTRKEAIAATKDAVALLKEEMGEK